MSSCENRESRRRQRQSGAAENRAAGLRHTARRCCDVALTSLRVTKPVSLKLNIHNYGDMTSQNILPRYDRHFVGIT